MLASHCETAATCQGHDEPVPKINLLKPLLDEVGKESDNKQKRRDKGQNER